MYEHHGEHSHHRTPQVLHTTKAEFEKFAQRVASNPQSTPMALQVGDDFNPPITTIAAPYMNPDRVRRDKSEVLKRVGFPRHGVVFFDLIASFDVDYPNFLLPNCRWGVITIACFQTTFMRERLSEVLRVDDQVYGLVSDAAHKIFKDRSKLLITTSSYPPVIKQWLPVLYSFVNGSTIEHFRHHFLVLFQTLTWQQHKEGLQVTDQDFAMVRFLSTLVDSTQWTLELC